MTFTGLCSAKIRSLLPSRSHVRSAPICEIVTPLVHSDVQAADVLIDESAVSAAARAIAADLTLRKELLVRLSEHCT